MNHLDELAGLDIHLGQAGQDRPALVGQPRAGLMTIVRTFAGPRRAGARVATPSEATRDAGADPRLSHRRLLPVGRTIAEIQRRPAGA